MVYKNWNPKKTLVFEVTAKEVERNAQEWRIGWRNVTCVEAKLRIKCPGWSKKWRTNQGVKMFQRWRKHGKKSLANTTFLSTSWHLLTLFLYRCTFASTLIFPWTPHLFSLSMEVSSLFSPPLCICPLFLLDLWVRYLKNTHFFLHPRTFVSTLIHPRTLV